MRGHDELQGVAHDQHDRDLHAGRRQHEDDDYDYHEDRGRVSGREEKLASLITADSGKGSVTAPLCYMSELNSDVIDEERKHAAWATPALSASRAGRHLSIRQTWRMHRENDGRDAGINGTNVERVPAQR